MTTRAERVIRGRLTSLTVFGVYWFAALVLLFLAGLLVEASNDSTVLTPIGDGTLAGLFAAPAVAAALSGAVGYTQSRGSSVRTLVAVLAFAVMGALATFQLATGLIHVAENRSLFAPASTVTFNALLPIGRAYRMRNSYVIQPAPLWANIDISKADYDVIAEGSGIDRRHGEPESVPSRGRFCARVTMQRSPDAVRVLHAGYHTLPPGSVAACPAAAAGVPYLVVR